MLADQSTRFESVIALLDDIINYEIPIQFLILLITTLIFMIIQCPYGLYVLSNIITYMHAFKWKVKYNLVTQ